MSNDVVVQKELFPTAQAAGALTESDVFARWRERGMEPVEVTPEQTIQRIVIEHNTLTGELKWTCSPNMDGLMAILNATRTAVLMPSLLVGDAAMSLCEYFTSGAGQLDLGTGKAAVVIGFDNGRMVLDWQPKDAPIAAKKLLAAALIFMVAKDAGLPIERLMKAMGMGTTD